MKSVVIVGAGIAGIEAAAKLTKSGVKVFLVEKEKEIGGHLRQWDRLFPTQENAQKVLEDIIDGLDNRAEVLKNVTVQHVEKKGDKFEITLTNNRSLTTDAVLMATGFDTFNARRKEEYGYGIYDNVITSTELEEMFKTERVLCTNGKAPERVAFVHCVGSRDAKVGNRYCSKVCCVTAVKQASEVKQLYPEAEVYNFYMDLRMFDRKFEDMYHEAQTSCGVQFVRGRLSEAAETKDGRLQIKAEDTLLGKPLKLTVDMLVLMTGMEPCSSGVALAKKLKIEQGSDRFFNGQNAYNLRNFTSTQGLFLAGTCTGPKTIPETLADARAAAAEVLSYLTK
ncbi:MAG: FAD-dependent oxidoreductase [Prevotellaceae bacterium]|jgi:heterodisulfide reductase subunit A|nr:FAD-dependent oxidoreductase [Prevotellaceae bacterium]